MGFFSLFDRKKVEEVELAPPLFNYFVTVRDRVRENDETTVVKVLGANRFDTYGKFFAVKRDDGSDIRTLLLVLYGDVIAVLREGDAQQMFPEQLLKKGFKNG